jgi:hypothetical protein
LSEADDASPTDLTGYWSGEYWYDAGMGKLAQFAAHISDAGGSFDGTTLESTDFGLGVTELSASISGSREGANVEFVKRYDAGQRVGRNPIFYAGVLNADLTLIDGIWTLTDRGQRLSGGFRMQRGSKGPKAAVKREAKEPVLAGVERSQGPVRAQTRKPRRK